MRKGEKWACVRLLRVTVKVSESNQMKDLPLFFSTASSSVIQLYKCHHCLNLTDVGLHSSRYPCVCVDNSFRLFAQWMRVCVCIRWIYAAMFMLFMWNMCSVYDFLPIFDFQSLYVCILYFFSFFSPPLHYHNTIFFGFFNFWVTFLFFA